MPGAAEHVGPGFDAHRRDRIGPGDIDSDAVALRLLGIVRIVAGAAATRANALRRVGRKLDQANEEHRDCDDGDESAQRPT
jgi:hypothetical protein